MSKRVQCIFAICCKNTKKVLNLQQNCRKGINFITKFCVSFYKQICSEKVTFLYVALKFYRVTNAGNRYSGV